MQSELATRRRVLRVTYQRYVDADRAWTAEADYMFFRNFVPDCAKLATRLREHEGSTAYACQCNWISADTWAGKLPAQWFGG